MADNNQTMEGIRAELNHLREQIEQLISHNAGGKSKMSEELLEKLNNQLEYLRHKAGAEAHKAYEAGQAGIDQAGELVRRNPILSLAIAFGAGCLLSGLFRR